MQVAQDLYSAAQPIEIQVNLKTAGMMCTPFTRASTREHRHRRSSNRRLRHRRQHAGRVNADIAL